VIWEPFETKDLKGLRLSAASKVEVGSMKELRDMLDLSILARTVRLNGEIVAVVGVAAHTMCADHAFLWCATTELLEKRPVVGMRRMRQVANLLKDRYKSLEGVVAKGHENWIRLIGFTLGPLDEFDGKPHYTFSWSR
jgi:hypothetical protein